MVELVLPARDRLSGPNNRNFIKAKFRNLVCNGLERHFGAAMYSVQSGKNKLDSH
jgi:hypothetical protein